MKIKQFSCYGQTVWVLLDEDERILDWAELNNIERLERRIVSERYIV